MNNEQNVEGLNVSPAIAKPMLPAVDVSLFQQRLQNPNTFSVIWAKVWQVTKGTVYILSVQESTNSRVHPVDMYYRSPKACKAAFKRYWGKYVDESAQWSAVRQ